MKIQVTCENCGKQYSVDHQSIGKTANCSCGTVITITEPSPDADALEELAGLGEAGWREPQRPIPTPLPPAVTFQAPAAIPPAPSAGAGTELRSPFAPVVPSAATQSQTWNSHQHDKRTAKQKADQLRLIVASAAILYAIFSPIYSFLLLGIPTFTFLDLYPALIIIGAALIIAENRWGPGVTALSILFGGFMHAYVLVVISIVTLSPLLLIVTIATYTVPTLIFVWCVQEERRRPPPQ